MTGTIEVNMEQEIKRGPGRPPKYHEQAVAQAAVAEMPSPANLAASNTTNDYIHPERAKRNPFGNIEQKLNYVCPPGFHLHVFNDVPGRIQTALDGGYVHLKDKEGKICSRVVGVAEGGGPLTGYPMIIPKEWWESDLAEQQKQVNEKEDTMRRGELEKQAGDNRYVPAQGIKISHGR